MRRTALRHLNLADRVRAEINKLRSAIAEERPKSRTERLQRLQERKARLTDKLVALEIKPMPPSGDRPRRCAGGNP
ncbi:hypothetical protein ER13_09820 [Brevundimonas sp. EAKA]|nr:hypothetical protein ER13_09820 [Brevundimonas sp. EAKA]